jgi:predicted PurR-regulated permease PerM
MKVKLEIDTKTFVRFWLVVIGFVVAGMMIYNARTALVIIGASLFLALALNGPVTRLAKILPGKSRVAGTAISYAAVVLALGAFMFLVVPPIIQQTAKVAETIPPLVNSAIEQYKGLNSFVEHYNLQPQVDSLLNSVKDSATTMAGAVGSNIISGIGSIFYGVSTLIMILTLSFFMLVEGPAWLKRLWSLYDNNERMMYHRSVLQRMYSVVTGYVLGQFTVSAFAGLASGIGVFALSFIFNIPADLAIPAIAILFILSMIPMFGETIGVILLGLILLFNDPSGAVAFLVFFLLYNQVENNYIVPKVQSKRLELSALVILASVIIGIYMFGIAGGIISIPIAGCIKIFVEEYILRVKNKRLHKNVVDDEKLVKV